MNNEEIAYQETLDYLYSFIDYSMQRTFRYSAEKFDLARMQSLVAALGNPQESYPIIHIAGTKGKGSVASLCAASLGAAGLRVGLYTSPHLQDYAERIQVDGEWIPHTDLVSLVEKMKPIIEAIPELSTFEITTALAFLYFIEQNVDAAVIEVGLGGRLDATNVVNPIVSVITSLSYDHTYLLGDTLSQIAAEKAGIIKPGKPVVLAPQKDEARQVVALIAAERSSPLLQVGEDILFAPLEHSLQGQSLLVWNKSDQEKMDRYLNSGSGEDWEPTRLWIPLLGYHQIENAATAFAALQVARQQGLPVCEADIRKGMAEVVWPGRFEILHHHPTLVLDSAHNRDSALKLRLALDDYFPGVPVVLIFGASEDKDLGGLFAELMPRVEQVIATQSIHPRAAETGRLVELAHQYGRPATAVVPIEDALEDGLRRAGANGLVLVTGSIFVAAGARYAWQTDPSRYQAVIAGIQ